MTPQNMWPKSKECNIRVEGMPWPKTGGTHYYAQLELPDKELIALEHVTKCIMHSN